MKKTVLLLLLLVSLSSFAQKYNLGDQLTPKSDFKLIGTSSRTGVSHYKYIGVIKDTYYYDRRIDDIVIGIKNRVIVTTIYNLIPESRDIGVPKSIINKVQSGLSFPLAKRGGVYGVNIDDITISLSRTTNQMTFNKDRIMIFRSIKRSVLKQ